MNVSKFEYVGPRADYCTGTGSPLWGFSTDQVVAARKKLGWRLNFDQRVPTPYGLGPAVYHYTLPNGRGVIHIPSYGIVRGEETDFLTQGRRFFWILANAGVKVLLIGGTSGTNDWRGLSTLDSIQPGDFVLPTSFDRQDPMVGRLPDMNIGGILPNLARMADPFCVSLSSWLADKAESVEVEGHPFFRKVHRTRDVEVILQQPLGEGSFETAAETKKMRALSRSMSEKDDIPSVYLHGDCISPLMCRHLGIHLAYYHLPVNWAEGHPAAKGMLTETLDDLYVRKLPPVMLPFENDVLATIEIPTDCTCKNLLKKRPDVYLTAITPGNKGNK